MNPQTVADFEAKNTLFLQHATLNCRGRLVSLQQPLVMGILNITPDSFYDGGRYFDLQKGLQRAAEMVSEGADIIDIGAVSTRPGATPVTEGEELKRLQPIIEGILSKYPDTILSVDTYRSEVARRVIGWGASMINDISGGTMDPEMFGTIASLKVPYVLMHIQGTPETMQTDPSYSDVTREVIQWLADRVYQLRQLGVCDIIVDPGFGFGKSASHNYTLMRELDFFRILQLPLLIGVSRKSMVYKSLNINSTDSLTGSTALHYHALTKGAGILRVHDVQAAVQTIEIFRLVHPNPSVEAH
jgi:dihydropteroate synthase